MNRKPNLLITGASGFTGLHACNHFSDAGFCVTAVTRQNMIPIKDIIFESCDLTIKENITNLIQKHNPQYVLHLAGQNHVGQSWIDPVSSLEVNTIATAYLLEALRKENPSCKIVIVGSALQSDLENMSTPPHPYSLSKTLQVVIARSWVNLYDMHIVIAKPTNLIGPGFSNGVCSIFAKKFIDMENNKVEKILKVNNLGAQRDFLDVRDAVCAYEILLNNGEAGETYDIASGKSRSLEEVINCFKPLVNVDFSLISQTNDLENKVEIRPFAITKLGWKPNIMFESSIQDILNFYRITDFINRK